MRGLRHRNVICPPSAVHPSPVEGYLRGGFAKFEFSFCDEASFDLAPNLWDTLWTRK